MNEHTNVCPLCGEGQLVEHTHERHYEIEGYAYVITGLLHSLCDHCGEYVTTPEQSRHNKRAIIAARDRAVAERDRAQRLTPADILGIRKRLQLTQVQAARVFGGGPNAFGKYENAEVAPSDGIEKLLRLADSVPEAAAWLMRRAGLPAPAQTPCSREKDCVVLQRLLTELPFHAPPALVRGVAAAELASFRGTERRAYCFTYSVDAAANDPRGYSKPDLAAVG